jgi:hypothetical protein
MMIEPPPARRIAGTAYLTDRNTPSRLTGVCRRQSVNDISIAWHKMPIPAFATITSRRPKRRSAVSIIAGQVSSALPLGPYRPPISRATTILAARRPDYAERSPQ